MKDLIRMQQLAGLITENQANKMLKVLNEGKNEDLEVTWTIDLDKGKDKYFEKGLNDGFETIEGGKKAKAIIGYYYKDEDEDDYEDDYEDQEEDVDIIGYITSKSGNIEKYDDDTLTDVFLRDLEDIIR